MLGRWVRRWIIGLVDDRVVHSFARIRNDIETHAHAIDGNYHHMLEQFTARDNRIRGLETKLGIYKKNASQRIEKLENQQRTALYDECAREADTAEA